MEKLEKMVAVVGTIGAAHPLLAEVLERSTALPAGGTCLTADEAAAGFAQSRAISWLGRALSLQIATGGQSEQSLSFVRLGQPLDG